MSDRVDSPYLDHQALAMVSDQLDLRAPNEDAVRAIVDKLGDHERQPDPGPLEVVVDSAVGVGKTYVMAAAIDYFAIAEGTRNFVIVTPGRVVLEKTIANFTVGATKSLAEGMDSELVVVTAENFDTARKRVEFDDPNKVKLFVFTVQSLLTPRGETQKRRTHSFQEGLGRGLYEHLQAQEDLIVLADEHHTYYGKVFSEAIRELEPRLLVGLTGTPHPKTPEEAIVYRYPLAAAIADQYVKAPVLVGRRDDRNDVLTQLNDGAVLLAEKQKSLDIYCDAKGLEKINAVMLVLSQTIDEAREVADLIESDGVAGGELKGHVLEIHSGSSGEEEQKALEALASVESPDSPVRAIVAVDKLKEGWDVKNVYVLASLRASVSKILTEQTLGRGLRLPFGEYTGREFLDTLEVLAHERYEDLLKKRNVLNEQFVSYRTAPVAVVDRHGNTQIRQETVGVSVQVDVAEEGMATVGKPTLGTVEDRKAVGEAAAMVTALAPSDPFPVPVVRTRKVEDNWTLAKIVDLKPFKELGAAVAADPDAQLRRTVITAQVEETDEGLHAAIAMREAADEIVGSQPTLPFDEARKQVRDMVLRSEIVPARPEEKTQLDRLLDAFVEPMGDRAAELLTAYPSRAAARLIDLIRKQWQTLKAAPTFDPHVELTEPFKIRIGRENPSENRKGAFRRGQPYHGWKKSMYGQDWFDSSTERDVANLLDGDKRIARWVRLQRGDIPITWTGTGARYNPDFIAVDTDGKHWIVEVKADKDIESEDVKGKADAAREAANHIYASPDVDAEWVYLLVGETDVAQAKDSWEALKGLGR